jgi:hypothetical protein
VSRNTVLLVVSCLYVLISVISAVPAFVKHSSHMPLLMLGYGAFIIVLVLCVAQVWRWPVGDRIGWTGTALVLLAFAIAAWRLYPPTRDVVPRSSAPDALIAPVTRLLSGTNPYSAAVGVDGVPASPGPAWILVHAPVTVSGLIWLMSVAHLALLSAAVGLITRSGRAALCVVVLMLAMPSFLQASLTGQDLFAAGCALTVALSPCSARREPRGVNDGCCGWPPAWWQPPGRPWPSTSGFSPRCSGRIGSIRGGRGSELRSAWWL